ncbi:hypothetical protein GCM10010182_41100 [Actinomadura cremea]|nr:hypothetical protein GCM10010182_41100 [Actinomadura cremea]
MTAEDDFLLREGVALLLRAESLDLAPTDRADRRVAAVLRYLDETGRRVRPGVPGGPRSAGP